MQARDAEAIRSAIRAYALDQDAPSIDVTRLVGEEGFRLRVGGWRCLFTIEDDDELIRVYSIRRRGDVYNR